MTSNLNFGWQVASFGAKHIPLGTITQIWAFKSQTIWFFLAYDVLTEMWKKRGARLNTVLVWYSTLRPPTSQLIGSIPQRVERERATPTHPTDCVKLLIQRIELEEQSIKAWVTIDKDELLRKIYKC